MKYNFAIPITKCAEVVRSDESWTEYHFSYIYLCRQRRISLKSVLIFFRILIYIVIYISFMTFNCFELAGGIGSIYTHKRVLALEKGHIFPGCYRIPCGFVSILVLVWLRRRAWISNFVWDNVHIIGLAVLTKIKLWLFQFKFRLSYTDEKENGITVRLKKIKTDN